MMLPTVNLNGTSRRQLLEQQLDAIDALRKAIEALQNAAPNGRDYLPQGTPEGTARLNQAIREHVERIGALQSVMKNLETIGESL